MVPFGKVGSLGELIRLIRYFEIRRTIDTRYRVVNGSQRNVRYSNTLLQDRTVE